eukprot:m.44094 g.44094  ORF g.44094 m.44094 type:complete len:215 (-) comp14897_c0_seq3:8-652(-)
MIEVSPPLTRKPKARTRRARRAAEKVGGGSARAHTVTDKESALFSDDDAPQKEDQRAGAAPKSEGDDDAKFIGSAIALAVITFQIMSNWWDSILFFTAMMACIACGIAMFFTGLQRVVATSTISIRTVDEVVKLEPGPPPGEFAKIFARCRWGCRDDMLQQVGVAVPRVGTVRSVGLQPNGRCQGVATNGRYPRLEFTSYSPSFYHLHIKHHHC